MLRSLLGLLTGYRIGALPQVIDLATLDPADLQLVEESLGAGEVSILASGRDQVQETRLTGIWRVRMTDDAGRVHRDLLEVSDIPGFVRYGTFDDARDRIELQAPSGSAKSWRPCNEPAGRRLGRQGADGVPHLLAGLRRGGGRRARSDPAGHTLRRAARRLALPAVRWTEDAVDFDARPPAASNLQLALAWRNGRYGLCRFRCP